MADDLKKTKADRKRIALGQKHEVEYMKKIAKEQLKLLKGQVGRNVWGAGGAGDVDKCSKAKLIRICKLALKVLK